MDTNFTEGINLLLKNIEKHEEFQLQVYEALKIIVDVLNCEYGYISQIHNRKSLISEHNPRGIMFKQIAVYGLDPDQIEHQEKRLESMGISENKTIYGDSLYEKQIMIKNDPITYNNNMPKNHPEFKNFTAIPVSYNGEYLGQIGLADCNEPDGFTLDRIKYYSAFYSIVGGLLMTEKIESERAKLLEEKEITKAKNMFMANVSHEIRTPLNSIMGSIDYLSEIDLSRTANDALEDMKQSSFNLLYLVNDILDISGLESDKMDINLSPEHLDVITQAAYLVTKSNKTANVKFSDQIDPAIPKCIITDPQRVKQILINLLSNAFKFTESGYVKLRVSLPTDKDLFDLDLLPIDKISMTPPITPTRQNDDSPRSSGSQGSPDEFDDYTSVVKNHYMYRKGAIEPARKGKKFYIKFSVTDTGIGIKQKDLNKLFKSFSQIDSSTTKKYGGTGLGLAISAGFSKLMQGGIRLTSEWKRGSTFYFVIPVQEYTNEEREEIDYDLLEGKHILVVDDKVSNIIRLTRILDKYGIFHTECQSPKHAIASYINNPRYEFDVGMIDIYMPEMSGNELAEYITKVDNAFPLIALSSVDSNTNNEISNNFYIMLQKPYSEEQIIKALYSVFKTTKTFNSSKSSRSSSSRVKSVKHDSSITRSLNTSDKKSTKRVRSRSHSINNLNSKISKQSPKSEKLRKKKSNKRMSLKLRNASIGRGSGDSIDTLTINYNVNMNILIVEDNYYNQKTAKRLLNMLGYYNLTICDGGHDAIRIIKENKGHKPEMKGKKINQKSAYDLILMDVVMPEMDGITASRKITRLFKSREFRPKIIAVTANVMPGDRDRCLQDGQMDAYISKPINKEELRDLLAQF